MGQTILDEYIAAIEEDDDSRLPDPNLYGFSSIATMLAEAQEVMESLGETCSQQKRSIAQLEAQAEAREAALIQQVDIAIDLQQYIAELEASIKK